MVNRKPISLWALPKGTAIAVNLRRRYADYPYFEETLSQYVDLKIPNQPVPVLWVPIQSVLVGLDDDYREESDDWISDVRAMMRAGEDVPPVLLDGDQLFDGRHRAWAAELNGHRWAPVVDIGPFWTPSRSR